MRVFLIAWVVFCFLVIMGLFIAYATDNFPGMPVPQAEYAQGKILTEAECSPCEENLKRLKAARERWERERNAQEAVTVSNTGDSP